MNWNHQITTATDEARERALREAVQTLQSLQNREQGRAEGLQSYAGVKLDVTDYARNCATLAERIGTALESIHRQLESTTLTDNCKSE